MRLPVPRRAVTLTLVAAIVGLVAAGISFAARRHLDEDVASFVGDIVDVILVVLVLGLLTAWVAEGQRSAERRAEAAAQEASTRARLTRLSLLSRLAGSAWNALPTDDDSSPETPSRAAETLRERACGLRDLYADLVEARQLPTSTEEDRLLLGVVCSSLASRLDLYAGEGMRVRRFERLDQVSAELKDLADDPDVRWAAQVQRFRSAPFNALGWRLHTDGVIIERLIAQRAFDFRHKPTEPGVHALLTASAVEPSVVAVEPVWLVVGYLSSHCGDLHDSPPAEVFDLIRRVFGSLRNEVFMISVAYDALSDVLESIDPLSAVPTADVSRIQALRVVLESSDVGNDDLTQALKELAELRAWRMLARCAEGHPDVSVRAQARNMLKLDSQGAPRRNRRIVRDGV